MDIKKLVVRSDVLIEKAKLVVATKQQNPNSFDNLYVVDSAQMAGLRSSGLSFISKVFGESHPYYKEFHESTNDSYDFNARNSLGILREVKEEIEGGWVVSLETLISAQIFSDFLEMAEHLLSQGYVMASAVTAGSTLEAHLRKLAENRNIPTISERNGKEYFKKADTLNSDLVKANVYTKIDQKIITAWLGVRNAAAHGDNENYTKEQVENMVSALPAFISRFSE